MRKLFLCLCFIFMVHICEASITVADFVTADDVTIAHLQTFKNTVVNAINSADGSLLTTGSVTTAKLADNANPEKRWDESFNDFVYTGLTVPTSTSLTSTTVAGTAYIDGVRVVKDATSKTYTASKHTFVDLSKTGTYTYSEVAINASEPSVTANSIRLARVSTDTTKVLEVRDDRSTTPTILGSATMVFEGATDNAYETTFAITDPTADRTITFPDATFTVGGVNYTDTRFATGTFSRDISTASGTQAVTGVGFTPTAVIFFSAVDSAAVTGRASWGMDNGTTSVAITDNTATATDTYTTDTSSIATYCSSSDIYRGEISAFGSDGFTITWTKSSSPTGTIVIKYIALR